MYVRHDIHMLVTDQGAVDTFKNFEERFTKEKDNEKDGTEGVVLYDISTLASLNGACLATPSWHTQTIRSISPEVYVRNETLANKPLAL
eukprot:Awhi_evm5s4625